MRSRFLWGIALLLLAVAALIAAPLPATHVASQTGWAPQVLAEEGGSKTATQSEAKGGEKGEAEEEVVKLGPVRGYRLLDLEWDPGPFPKTLVAYLAGDPKTGMHHTYLKMDDGARIAPHAHSTDEYITVVSGTLLFGQGDDVDEKAARLFGPGAFIFVPAKTNHYSWAKGPVVLSTTRSGAADFLWVHPEDDPAKAKKEEAAPAAKP
jgi:uncharacterized RmlC-like cupin family protein